jgi:molybdate transport system substrate-binding protein
MNSEVTCMAALEFSGQRMPPLAVLLAVVAALGGAPAAFAAQVSVAVTANFAAPMQQIAKLFQQDTSHEAVLSIGSTGRFHAQITHGAPFQVMLSADDETAARLEREGLAVPGTRHTYAVGRLVLWSRDTQRVDSLGQVLRAASFDRLAVADPKLAPYGAAAMQVLDSLGLRRTLAPRLVVGESVAQAYQFVATGNAPLGFVARSQVMVDGRLQGGSAWLVPAELHAPIRQDAVLLLPGQGQPAALALMAYLRSEKARDIVRRFGYDL